MTEPTISDVLRELEPGAHATFDIGILDGGITVTRSKVADRIGQPPGEFVVKGVTSASPLLSADEAQADVARRRQIRDRTMRFGG